MKHLRLLLSFATLHLAFVMPALAADVTITAANFRPGAGAKFHTGIAGATVTAGQPIAISPSTGKFVLADGNDVDLVNIIGVAAHAAIDTQPLAVVWYADDMTPGFTLVMSTMFYGVSATAGGIAPVADLSAGGVFPHAFIVAISTTKCKIRCPGLLGSALSVAP